MSEPILDTRDKVREHYAITAEGKGSSRVVDSYSTSGTTSTLAFIGALRAAGSDQRLVFQLDEVPLIAPGYHVTEVKAVSYNTMDCGGVADKCQETVIQLWNPGDEPHAEYMTASKFLAIYDRAAADIPVSDDAEVRFEHGDSDHPACIYHVQNLDTRGELIFVHLRAPIVTCKARDRKKGC